MYFSRRRGRFELNAILPNTRRIEYIERKLEENGNKFGGTCTTNRYQPTFGNFSAGPTLRSTRATSMRYFR